MLLSYQSDRKCTRLHIWTLDGPSKCPPCNILMRLIFVRRLTPLGLVAALACDSLAGLLAGARAGGVDLCSYYVMVVGSGCGWSQVVVVVVVVGRVLRGGNSRWGLQNLKPGLSRSQRGLEGGGGRVNSCHVWP